MADNKNDEIIDFDELEELPDVVLGEKTIAIRTMHENGKNPEEIKQEVSKLETEKKKDTYSNLTDSLLDDQLDHTPIESFFDQEIHVQQDANESTVERKFNEIFSQKSAGDETVALEKTEISLDLDPLKKGQKYRNGTRLDYLGNSVQIEDFNPNTSRYKIVDNGKTKWVTDKNLRLVDPEIPPSLQDDDPGVEDELSSALEENNETVAINMDSGKEVKDELSEIYEGSKQEEPVGKHGRTSNKVNVVKTTVPFEELYKEAIVPPKTESEEDRIQRMKRRKKTPFIQKLAAVVLVVLIAVLLAGILLIYDGLQPVTSTSEEVKFTVEEGATAKDVTQQLEDEGIIKNADVAYTYIRFLKLTDVKQGIFTLDKSWDLKQMFTYLNDDLAATTDQAMVTIIEGDWAKDAASKFEEVTNVTAEELLELWNDKDWITSQKDKYPFITDDMFKDGVRIYLEGYLAPNTYYINKETTAEEITTTLLDQTLSVYNKYADEIEASGRSIADIYTMASIIQYEAGTNPDDLKTVASVFYNRLEQGMLLQSSVTVCYAIDFDKMTDNWQTCELNPDYDSPYNTYVHEGLTPGPIENPGEAALEAAINPADTNYLYFMAETCENEDGEVTGTVHYAETVEEHNANVAEYLNCY